MINLNTIPDEALQKYAHAGLFQLCMKHIHDKNIMPFVQQSMGLMRDLEQMGQHDTVDSVVNYWLAAENTNDKIELIDKRGLKQQLEVKA